MRRTIALFSSNKVILVLSLFIFLIMIPQVKSYSLCDSTQSSCLICPIQCAKCDSNFSCSACSLQYCLSGGQCVSCPQYCLTCNSPTSCIRCKDPYVLVNGTCKQCTVQNALSCTTISTASLCEQQYYVNQNYCSSCLLNCKTCTSSSTCSQCIDSFYLNNTVLTCNPCPTNCMTCDQFNPNVCTSCSKGYSLINGGCTLIDCSLVNNCVYCSSVNVCGQCEMFYYWNGQNCVMGASVLCEYGSSGPLPSDCINQCAEQSYRSQLAVPFLCIPYKTVKSGTVKMSQTYYNAYADQVDFQRLSSLSDRVNQMYSNGEYFLRLSMMNFSELDSFYKIQLRIKYVSEGSVTMNLSSKSQSSPSLQEESTILNPSTLGLVSLSYSSRIVHSNNLLITFSQEIKVIETFIRIYRCPQSCLQCLNEELCELCVAPMYMLDYKCVSSCTVYYHFAPNRTCVLNCPFGYYYSNNGTNNKFCQACLSPCSNCIDSTKCLSCLEGYYFYNYTCTTSCPDQYYPLEANNTCDNCISPCRTCVNKTDCLSCKVGFWNGNNCTSTCQPGYYGNNLTKKCQLCDPSCLTCANSSTSCTSCNPILYLHNRQCLSSCPSRFYPSIVTPLSCISCKPPCQSCSSETVCLSCAYNYFYGGSCVINCPNGYFSNLINNTCTKCSSSCKTCSSAVSCDSCQNGLCLYQGQCIANCPSQAWYKSIDSVNNECKCQQCKFPCKQCLSVTECVSCIAGYLQGNQCLTQCPITYHKNEATRQCILCNITFPYCNQCTQTKCTSCQQSYLLHLGNCLTSCPQLYYQSSQRCLKCIAPCQDCTGFSNCTSCITGYILYQNQCVISCPLGKFTFTSSIDGKTTSQCSSCQAPCLYCTESASKCTFCQSSYYLYNNSCYQNCSSLVPLSTFYNEPVTSTCSKCLFPCKTCQSQYECSSCMIGYLNSVDKKCTQCKVGTYPNNTAGVCETCPSQCVICYDKDYCTICNDGFYLYQNQCISNLSICELNGYYGIGRVCVLCQQPCKTCSNSATNCTSCLEGYTFFFSANKCLVQCPTGYFRNSATNQCDACSPECTSCVGSANYCFSCSTGYKLYLSSMKCLEQCPQYTFTESSFCSACKYPCVQCISQTSCLSCITGSLVGNQCLSSCSSGYFTNSQNICQACDLSCKQCSLSPTNCTQCPQNTFLYDNECLTSCPQRTFAETQSQKCISCMGTCYECSSHINCTSCSNNLYFFISLITNEGQCVSSCPNGYYSNNKQNLCVLCRSDCLTCSDGVSCLLCNNGKVMFDGECYTECPQRMYSYQGVCQNCKQPCYNCTDTTTCKSCMNNSYLLVGNAQCMEGPMCPVGYFLLQNQTKCNSQCPSGVYHIPQNRTCSSFGCGSDYFKGVDYYCYDQCPQGYIADQWYQCQSCVGNQCRDGLFFSLKYTIRHDELMVKLFFTQTPKYLVDQPSFIISPSTQYSLQTFLSVNQNGGQLTSVSATSYHQGSKTLTFTLNPLTSLQQTYFKVKFSNPLPTFQNPLQHSSSTFYLQGYDKYNNDQLSDLSGLGILALFCALIGLFKNSYMTDFGQLLWILALNNVHYPYNLRTFLEGTKIAHLHKFLSISQPNMQGTGKFAYVVNDGLLENAFGNILIVLIGLAIAVIGLVILKFLQWYLEYGRIGGSVAPNEQKFIHNNNEDSVKYHQQTSIQASNLPKSIRLKNFLQSIYTIENFKILYINRFIYFNYLPICLFTFTQLSNLDTSSSLNLFGFALAFFTLFMVVFYPFALLKDKPKFTFLYIRKVVVALGLILSVNYPAYCVGVLSVCNITAILLIRSYKLQKWRLQTQFNAIGEAIQLFLMIGMAVFIMIGEGYQTSFKASFSYVLIFISVGILLYYILFSLFLFVLWLIKKICNKDYITEWIEAEKKEDTDGTDSETMNSSMKDHQEKKIQPQQQNAKQQDINWNNIEDILKNQKDDGQNFIQGQINDFIQTKPLGVSPSKVNIEEVNGKELFWNYETNSQQDERQKDKQPPKMLIRCVNEFSDFDHRQQISHQQEEEQKKKQKMQKDQEKPQRDKKEE